MSEETKVQEVAETAEADAAQDASSNEEAGDDALDFEQADDAAEFDEEDEGVVIHDADAEDALEEARLRAAVEQASGEDSAAADGNDDAEAPHSVRGMAEMMAIIEALIFVAEEPLSVKALADVLREDRGWIETALEGLAEEFNARGGGLHLREVAGGWQFATRPEHHEHVRAFLKTRPSAKLSLASLETLAVIAYKQPITVPEILEIRGVQSPSAIKTLLDKRLIIAKGRKETIGRPMMYGTSKEFLLQFGLKDLSELPNVEDFEDLAGGM
jgi:segregation and condensation protein B